MGSDPPTTQAIKHKGGIKRSNILDFALGEYHTVLSPFGVRRGSGGREGELEKVRGRSLRFVRKLKAKGGSISLLLLLDRRLPSEAEERSPVVL